MNLPANPGATKSEPVYFLPQKDASIHIITAVSLQVISRRCCHHPHSPRMAQTPETLAVCVVLGSLCDAASKQLGGGSEGKSRPLRPMC